MLLLGIITFIFTKDALNHEVVKAEINYVKTAEKSMKDFKSYNVRSLEKLAQAVTRYSYEELNTQEKLMQNTGKILKSFRDAGNFLAVYIAQTNGELIVSDLDSDSKRFRIWNLWQSR